ncbi:EamA family transporter RarD [Humibacter ginsenosidimutans]|uniref:EamA family transporter RarD n=1 Tax=Humibacter ginsenosidimutans TaxID=2599293 RepID=A0A5B8M523_9MICO|nr:EamA family transporter RarD [Humibacter ginsenosidimutans]
MPCIRAPSACAALCSPSSTDVVPRIYDESVSETDAPQQQQPQAARAGASATGRGIVYAVAAYLIWGFLPIYFIALAPTGPFEIVAWRVLFSLVFCAIAIAVTRAWRPFLAILKRPRIVLIMGAAGVLIYINWQTYVYATTSGQVVEASLGYFINPIVTVLLGVIVLRERLRVTQWVAIGISVIAVVVLTVGYGQLPWIALALAFSFGLYGLVKKQVGRDVDAVSGLTLETAWLAPVAVVQLFVVGVTTGITFGHEGTLHTVALIGAGVITAVPLLFFAAASRRLPLVVMGFIQYFTPILQFIVGVALLHEAMSFERWIGFALVWVALIVLTVDMVRAVRAQRRVGQTRADAVQGEATEAVESDPLPE